MQSVTRCLLVTVCLAGVTVVVMDSNARFERVAEIFAEIPSAIGDDWQYSRRGVTRIGLTPPELRLTPQSLAKTAYVARSVPHPRSYEYLGVSSEIRTDDLEGAVAPWHGGRLLLVSYDEHGRRFRYWPAVVANLDGTNAWHQYSEVIPVHADVDAMTLVAYAAAQSGSLRLRGLRLDSMRETMLFTALSLTLVCAWILTGLWLLYVLLRRPVRSVSRLLVIGVALIIVGVGIMPQPHLNNSLKASLFGAQDLIFAGNDFFDRIGATPEPGAGTDHAAKSAALDVDPVTVERAPSGPVEHGPMEAHQAHPSSERYFARTRDRSRYWIPRWKDLDKKEHLIAFFMLGFLAGFAYRQYAPVRVALCLAVLAGSIQAMQGLSITREPDIGDLQYDLLGMVLGLGIAYLLESARRKFSAVKGAIG